MRYSAKILLKIMISISLCSMSFAEDNDIKPSSEVTRLEQEFEQAEEYKDMKFALYDLSSAWDKDIKKTYNRVLEKYKDIPSIVDYLTKSHSLWASYKKKEIDLLYIEDIGSDVGIFSALARISLDKQRFDLLKKYINKQMSSASQKEVDLWDKELNSVYSELLSENKESTKFYNAIKTSAKAWLSYRDAEMKLFNSYAGEGKEDLCRGHLVELTKQRIDILKESLGFYSTYH